MEKEKPILLSDLIPPEELDSYVPEHEDVIPIRTWSRGDPFDLDGGFEMAFQTRHQSVGNSQSTDGTNGMLNYTAIQPVFDGREVLEEEGEDGEEVNEGDEVEENDADYGADFDNEGEDGEYMPDYKTINHGSVVLAEEDGSVEADYDAYLDEGDEANGAVDGGGSEEEEEEEEYEEDEPYPREEDDEVNYDDDEDGDYADDDDVPGGFEVNNEHFEKVMLSPREMELIASSEHTGEVNDLVDIMNEYNELVNYLASPRGNPKKAGGGGGSKPAGIKSQVAPKAKAAAAPPVNRRILPHSDSEGEEGSSNGEDDIASKHSSSNQAMLTRDKLSILTGMVGSAAGGKVSSQSNQHASAGAGAGAGAAKKPPRKKPVNDGKKKPKKKLFGQALEDHKALAMQMKLVVRSEVDSKQKAMLASMVEARRRDEEEMQREAERAIAKRKKFKEALLEKALRARQAQMAEEELNGGTSSPERAPKPQLKKEHSVKVPQGLPAGATPNFLAPTKAFQVQSMPAKQAPQVVLTDEDLIRQEQEKHENIAAIRRKFKEQHKKILNALKKKNEEDGKKLEEEALKEAAKKEKHRIKLQRMLSEKYEKADVASAAALVSADDATTHNPAPAANKPHPRSAQPLTSHSRQTAAAQQGEDGDDDAEGKGAVGSGLAAIRRRVRSLSQSAAESGGAEPNLLAQQRLLQKQQKEEEAAIEESLKEAMQKELRKVASKEQQAKLTNYLNNIAEQRKKEEADKKKSEERAKKRVQLLSARLLQEAGERKLMHQNDTWRYAHTESAAATAVPAPKPVRAKVVAASETPTAAAAVSHKPRPPVVPAPSAGIASMDAAKAPKKAKITQEMADKLSNRLNAQTTNATSKEGDDGHGSSVPARDFADWKRKNGVPADAMVFAMTGWYPCVKEALIARGWYYNSDITSPYFNLKWTLRSLDVLQETLQPWQLTNHYLKNVAITTKAGLIKSLQSLVWTADVEANDIIPRGYDLSNNLEMQAFLDDFRTQKAESILKAMYLELTGLDLPAMKAPAPLRSPRADSPDSESTSPSEGEEGAVNQTEGTENKKKPTANPAVKNDLKSESLDAFDDSDEPDFPDVPPLAAGVVLENISVNVAVFEAILSVLEKQIKPYEDTYIDDRDAHTEKLISDLEWELISQYDIHQSFNGLPSEAPEPVDAFLKEKEDMDVKPTPYQQREKRRLQKLEDEAREEASGEGKKMRALNMQDLERIHYTLCSLMHHDKYQTGLNGKGNKSFNMWIVKPAAKSRGRGIATFMDLNKLLKYVDAGTGRYTQWIVQKYMENPLIIANRKFDLRQWVVVTNWNPVTIYFYDECYARFSVEEYSTDVNDLSNSFIHLVNNSIGKNSENFNKVITAENGVPVEGYMWSFDQVCEFIKFRSGEDLMRSKVHPRMKDIAKWSLMCAAEMIEHRKNSWELYGFDFMVDDENNAWLIEINSSPACDYSTTVTERYVQKALVELLAVVLDVREWETQPKKTRGACPDTGGWEKIYQGPLLDMPVGAFGTEMSLKGEAYKNLPKPVNHANTVNVGMQQVDFGSKTASSQSQQTSTAGGHASNMSSRSRAPQAAASQDRDVADSPSKRAQKPAAALSAPKATAPSQQQQQQQSVWPVAAVSVNDGDDDDAQSAFGAEGGFDDSDDDGEGEPKKALRKAPTREPVKAPPASTLSSGSSSPPPIQASTAGAGSSRHNKVEPQKVNRHVGAPAVASIPIKVFSVDF